MKERQPKEIMEKLKKISKIDSIKMSYILSHLEEINKKYNLKITLEESRKLLSSNSVNTRLTRNPFDISATMRPK